MGHGFVKVRIESVESDELSEKVEEEQAVETLLKAKEKLFQEEDRKRDLKGEKKDKFHEWWCPWPGTELLSRWMGKGPFA